MYNDLNNDTNPKTFWQTKKQMNGNCQNRTTIPRCQDKNIKKSRKAETFKEYLQNIHLCPEGPLFDNTWKNIVDRQVNGLTQDSKQNNADKEYAQTKTVTITEMTKHKIIMTMTKIKASGEDDISNKLIKEAQEEYIRILGTFDTTCLQKGYFPKLWKSAVFKMIPNPGKDPHNPTNYRPISLLNNLGKLVDRILIARLRRTSK